MLYYPMRMEADEYRRMRIETGLTQAELAKLLGVTVITVQARENGRFRITDEAAIALRAVLSAALRSPSSDPAPTPPPTTSRPGPKRRG